MDLSAPVLIFYARNDALGDGLLRIPALRAAKTVYPQSHIVYGAMRGSSLSHVLRKHVAHLVDDFRTKAPLSAISPNSRRAAAKPSLSICAPACRASSSRLCNLQAVASATKRTLPAISCRCAGARD
ncbi:hypothetical protein [Mesorhizobium argentiipisi]|uniref:Uncharacterized protein n=1 Tax=Mesorhizobium argentiipisi TaxID=3015175 RepID=A0ABU8KHB8_9HYPH